MSAPIYEGTSPLVSDRYIITAIAGEDLTMGQVVEISTDWTVKKPTTNPSTKPFGVCLTSAKNGKSVSVVSRGLVRATAYGTINNGDMVISGPNGTVTTLALLGSGDVNTSAGTATAINNLRGILGTCIAGAASGGSAYILLI